MKINTLMMAAAMFACTQNLNAQSWNLPGNANATASSKLGTTNNIPLRLFTFNAERIHINANVSGKVGYVGIGTTAPAQRLHVAGNGLFTGNLGIGITSPTQKLHVSGNGLFTGSITASTGGISGTNTSSTGNGVFGSGYYGIYGTGTNTGVYGNGIGFGTGVSGTGFLGVFGTSSATSGDGVRALATGSSCYGVNAYSSLSFGVYGATGTPSTYAGYFAGNVFSTGNYLGSDRKLKQNITDFGNAMDVISQLQPKVYEYRQDGSYKLMNLPLGMRYGLIAQDVEEVLPGLVKKSEFNTAKALPQGVADNSGETIDFKAVNYTELIPIMIKAMQEQQTAIQEQQKAMKEQQQEIKDLKDQLAALSTPSNGVDDKSVLTNDEQVRLEQNAPNPFDQETIISYYLPANTTAQLKVMSLDGKVLITEPITRTGHGSVTISGHTMSAGTYTYTLIVNGTAVESKTMVLTK